MHKLIPAAGASDLGVAILAAEAAVCGGRGYPVGRETDPASRGSWDSGRPDRLVV